MKTIWKYEISSPDLSIQVPKGGKVLTVQTQHGIACIWILIDLTKDLESRRFITYGTGHRIDISEEQLEYIGTWQMSNGNLIFHTFEVK